MRGIDVFRTFVTRWYTGALPDIFFSEGQDPVLRSQICSVLAGYVWNLAQKTTTAASAQ